MVHDQSPEPRDPTAVHRLAGELMAAMFQNPSMMVINTEKDVERLSDPRAAAWVASVCVQYARALAAELRKPVSP